MGNNYCLFIEPYKTRNYRLWGRVKHLAVHEIAAML